MPSCHCSYSPCLTYCGAQVYSCGPLSPPLQPPRPPLPPPPSPRPVPSPIVRQPRPTTVQQPAVSTQPAATKPAAVPGKPAAAKPAPVAQPAATKPAAAKPAPAATPAATKPAVAVPAKPAAGRRLAGAVELPVAHAAELHTWPQAAAAEEGEAWWEGPKPLHSSRQLASAADDDTLLPQQVQPEQDAALQRSGRRLLATPGIKPLPLPTCDFGP